MPISQATILAIYGDLCDLCEKIETLHRQAYEADLFEDRAQRYDVVAPGILTLLAASKDAQAQALTAIVGEAPELEVNPLTGRIDE